MEVHSATWFADITAPLSARFGGALRLDRLDNAVRWAYLGQSAVIDLEPSGTLRATFIGSSCIDAVSARPSHAKYRARAGYRLDSAGAQQMIADLADFFSGVREPTFTFVDADAR